MTTATTADPASRETSGPVPIALVIAVVLTAILDVLDITIVTVAMPHMLGSFAAKPDQITWVLTSYLIATAVVMPLTGFLSNRLGRRRLLICAISGFVVTSALCGMAWNLESMVLFRIAQGACGAVLVPLAQAILFDAFPRDKRGQAMAVFGMGIMVAPVLGPPLGGWLTETLQWRSVFYINVPIGMIALLLALTELPRREVKFATVDWTGLGLMAVFLASLQFVLDQGQSFGWYESKVIQTFTAVVLVAGAVFLVRGWGKRDNIVDLHLFRDRNFLAATLTVAAFGIGMFGTIALLPLLTQNLMGYPADKAGLLFMPRAIASMVSLAVTGGILVKLVDQRLLVATGLVLSALGTYAMSNYSLQVDSWGLIWPGIIIGSGMGLFFVPLATIAFDNIPADKSDEAAGLFSVLRTIGASTGIALVSWLFVRQGNVHGQQLSMHANEMGSSIGRYLSGTGLDATSPEGAGLVAREIARQSQMLAFVDLFWFLAWATVAVIPLLLLMKRPKRTDSTANVH